MKRPMVAVLSVLSLVLMVPDPVLSSAACESVVPTSRLSNIIDLYTPSDVFNCYLSVPANVAETNELLTAAKQLSWFYAGTDISRSDLSVDKVDLEARLAEMSKVNYSRDFAFQRDLSQLFSKLKDGHTSYRMPSTYWATFFSAVTYSCKYNEATKEQQVYVHGFADMTNPGTNVSQLKVGDVVKRINGRDALEYLADLAFESTPTKTRGQALNAFLLSADTYRTRPFPFPHGFPDASSSLYGLVSRDYDDIVIERDGLSARVQKYADPNSISGNAFSALQGRAPTGTSRGAQTLSPQVLWNAPGMTEKARFPETGDPEALCGVRDGMTYVYIGTFGPTPDPSIPGTCGQLDVFAKIISFIMDCIGDSENIVLDVRGNDGGAVPLFMTLLQHLFPDIFKPAPDVENPGPETGMLARPYGAYALSLSPDIPKDMFDQYAEAQSYPSFGVYFSASTNEFLDPPAMEALIKRAKKRVRAPNAGERFVTEKFLLLPLDATDESLLEILNCTDQQPYKPTRKSKLKHVAFLSLGSCGSACSHFMEVLVAQGVADVVTLGGVVGEATEASAYSNGPVEPWNALVGALDDGRLQPAEGFTFATHSMYSTVDNPISAEFDVVEHPGVRLNMWPPYSAEDEGDIFTAAKELAMKPPRRGRKNSEDSHWVRILIVVLSCVAALVLAVAILLGVRSSRNQDSHSQRAPDHNEKDRT